MSMEGALSAEVKVKRAADADDPELVFLRVVEEFALSVGKHVEMSLWLKACHGWSWSECMFWEH